MMNNMISYIIRTKNEGEFLEETCRKIRAQRGKLIHEIIVVDSGSNDNTLDIAQRYADKIVQIEPSQFTWGYALNVGIEAASGGVICLISGHCILDNSNTMIKAYKFLMSSDFCCIYGRQRGNVYLDKMEAVELSENFPVEPVIGDYKNGVPGVSNACCLLKKAVWEKHKFDEQVQSAEDGIWCKEVLDNGYRVAYYPIFCVIHGHHFNVEYMYKKWYWRAYKSETILGRDKDWKKSNRIRFLLSFMIGMMCKYKKFYTQSRRIGVNISRSACKKYFLIREIAIYNAKVDLKKKKNLNSKYEELVVPKCILKLRDNIKTGEFYDI